MIRVPLAVLLASAIALGGSVVTPESAAASDAPGSAAAVATPGVLINEFANGGARSSSDSFFELRNWGSEPVDLTGWHVFRCSAQGLRSNVGRPEGDLDGVVLQPGEIFTVSRIGMPGDAHMTQPLAEGGFGLYLEGPDARLVDAVGVYPNEPWQTESECSIGRRNLPNRLDFAAGESWQRVAATGDPSADYIVAPATLGEQNRVREEPRAATGVVIAEVAASGPLSKYDEFVELVNTGSGAENIGGWELYRCTAGGRLTPGTHELTVPAGTMLGAGERWVIGGHDFPGEAQARIAHSLADVSFGVLLRSGDGLLVDRVAVSAHDDSACQNGDTKLPAILDPVAGESYQRVGSSFIVAPRTPGAANATVEHSVFREEFHYGTPGVAISELATDPSTEGMPAGSEQRNYIELGNYGSSPVDIGGWTVRRCEADGQRYRELQFTVPGGTSLAAGEVFLAARAGTDAASSADITYPESLNFLGAGVWVADAAGHRVDSVGVYAANEMDSSNVVQSPCTKGMALTTYLPDRLLAESFQRSRFTGVDAADFLVAEATPGRIDLIDWSDPTARSVSAEPAAITAPERARGVPRPLPGAAVTATAAWSGVTEGGPLLTREGAGERAIDPAVPGAVSDDAYGYPYQRFELDAAALHPGSLVGWQGSGSAGGELQLSVWNASTASWRLLDASASGTLSGALEAGDIDGGIVSLLVQDGPGTEPVMSTARDGELENPGDYDFSIAHITDTQYLSESYPEVYARLVSWIADHEEDRKIAFATHTGDLVQNWVDPDQSESRARVEFERASRIQSILDEAGVPNSVLPGNHDSKRGVDRSLFNEYFPPSRYAGSEWYGGSIAPGDNSSNYSTFDAGGARFLMLSLPYAYGEREIAWAQEVVAGHPDSNVIISTHEHVTPKTLEQQAQRSGNSRWVSRGQELWERVIAPNRNVVLVLSGHFHGIGQLVTQDAGGLPGHTVVELLADYQEFRTHTGERATGFYRMLQFDLDAGAVAVDTRSVSLAASYSNDFDYRQFLPDNGLPTTPSNARPWRIVEDGVQGRYTEADDEFTATVVFQHPKSVATQGLLVSAP